LFDIVLTYIYYISLVIALYVIKDRVESKMKIIVSIMNVIEIE